MTQPGRKLDVHAWVAADDPSKFVPVERPAVVSCWTKDSATKGGQIHYGSREGLSKFQLPSLPAALDEGYPDAFIKKDESAACGVESVVRAVLDAGIDVSSARIVSFRNNLNKLLGTPQYPEDAWVIDACRHGTTLFLDIVKTPEKSFQDADRFQYYGYKFETLCTGGGHTVDSTSEFSLLLRLSIGMVPVLMAAEIDCAGGNKSLSLTDAMAPDHFLELKTTKFNPKSRLREQHLAQKYPRWWIQSFLAGIPTIALGMRDGNGMLNDVRFLEVASLASTAEISGAPFNAWRMLRFGNAALEWMFEHANANPVGSHLRFSYQPQDKSIHAEVVDGGDLAARLHAVMGTAS